MWTIIIHREPLKTSQLIFVCNFVKNQQILMQFSLLDLEMNGTCYSNELHPPYLINVATLLCENQNTENAIVQRDITKENCTKFIIASSKWTKVMCLIFTYFGRYAAMRERNEDS